jgi:hypothetical protein
MTVEVRGRDGEWQINMLDGPLLHLARIDRDANPIRVSPADVRIAWPSPMDPLERIARGVL